LKKYEKVSNKGILKNVHAKDIKVGDILKIKTNERIPADMLLLMTAEKKHGSGGGTTVFVRTDQLDGETDWKLRKALPFTQNACSLQDLTQIEGKFTVLAPNDKIYDFNGYYQPPGDEPDEREPLALENTMW
jgi:phospholipid-translocating ATPase